jgi:ferritin-like metal-binding protein YciE
VTDTTTAVVSSEAFRRILRDLEQVAEQIERDAHNITKDAERAVQQVRQGYHTSGYSHQTLIECAQRLAQYQTLVNLAGSIGQDANDLEVMTQVLRQELSAYSVGVAS